MNKKCYILNAETGVCGVVKLEKGIADVDIKQYKPLGENEVFEVYFVDDEKLSHVGKMNSGKEIFSCREPENCSGIIITRGEKIEFWGGKDNVRENAKNLLFPQEDWDASSFYKDDITPETYFGGGFKWKRVNGYYSMYKYSIVMYVLSLECVKNIIAGRGYYLLGIKKSEGIHISIALLQLSDEENLFGELEEYSYSMNFDGKRFRAICLAIDESGEYFLY